LEWIGWCYVRSDESTGFLERDAQFHNWHFPRETDLLLVLKPEEQGVSIELFARSSNAPLSSQQYRYGSLRVYPETPANPPIEVKLEARNNIDDFTRTVPANTSALAQAAPSPRNNKLFRLLSATMFVFALGIPFGWAYIRAHYLALARDSQSVLGSTPTGPGLRIRVESSGNAVLVSWDRNATLVQSAKGGILRIDDGPLHRDINLEPSDIENSSIVYRPGSNDAKFRLELRGDHGSAVSNTVRVLDGSRSAPNPDITGDAGLETIASPAYVPPKALKRVSPNTKSFDPSNVQEGTEVDVQVRIDEQGRVVEAHVKSGTNDNDLLRSAALEAAKQWIFEPAKSHGKNIPSDHTVAFQFHP
jgi:TonB family protein